MNLLQIYELYKIYSSMGMNDAMITKKKNYIFSSFYDYAD